MEHKVTCCEDTFTDRERFMGLLQLVTLVGPNGSAVITDHGLSNHPVYCGCGRLPVGADEEPATSGTYWMLAVKILLLLRVL